MSKVISRIVKSGGAGDVLASLMAILVGLLVGLIILLISNPPQAFGAFNAILTSGLGDRRSMGQVLYTATPIIMTGLSVGFAARTGLFNIGAAGQFGMGAYAAVLVGVKCTFLPGHLHWIAALLAGMAAGAFWGSIPGILKAWRNVNEVIACIMMNYIGIFLANLMITRTVYDSLRNQSQRVASTANIPKMGLDQIFREGNISSSVNGGIFIAVIMAVIVLIVLEKTCFGFELKACGFNRDAARYAGISERRSIVYSMLIAGALAGLGGALLYLAGAGNALDVVDVLHSEGFNGIPVALLGLNHPIGIVLAGLLIGYLNVGGFNMQLFNFAPQVIEIIIATIIYFSAFTLLFKGLLQKLLKGRAPVATEKGAENR